MTLTGRTANLVAAHRRYALVRPRPDVLVPPCPVEMITYWLLTARSVVPAIAPDGAVIVDDPAATAVANPPVAIVATDILDELQFTEAVRS